MGAETCIEVAKSGAKPPRESCCALHYGGVLYVGLFHSHPAKVGNQHFRLRMLPLLCSGSKEPPLPPHPPLPSPFRCLTAPCHPYQDSNSPATLLGTSCNKQPPYESGQIVYIGIHTVHIHMYLCTNAASRQNVRCVQRCDSVTGFYLSQCCLSMCLQAI